MSRNWVAVASADRVAYYSPTVEFGGKNKFQAFTAIGIVGQGEPYQVTLSGGFQPYRRDVCWLPAEAASIRPILGMLEFSAGKQNWGYQFRFGIFVFRPIDTGVIDQTREIQKP
ncbi:MAG: EVE domain-containing protein [Acidithiobacillus ferrooxidans]